MKESERRLPSPEQRFRDFFKVCDSKQLSRWRVERMCWPIYWRIIKQEFGTFVKIVATLIGLWTILRCIPFLSWIFSAIGRILLIKVLPYYQWTDLYDQRCLIKRPEKDYGEIKGEKLNSLDCSVCENLDTIPVLSALPTFQELDLNYLSRAWPVAFPYKTTKQFNNFSEFIQNNLDFRPCDLRTSLIYNSKSTNLQEIAKRTNNSASFYFHFRNCDSKSLKSSRLIDGRPEFFAAHLPPAYSSWILMSRNYTSRRALSINLDGLVFIRQLKGQTELQLSVREGCETICPNHLIVKLNEDQGLLFTTELWDMSYSANSFGSDGISATFITETDWK